MNRFIYFASEVLYPSNPRTGVLGSVNFNLFLTKIGGFPYPDFKNKKIGQLHYIYCLNVLIICNLLYTFCEQIDLFYSLHDLNALTKNACLTLSHISGTLKYINVFFRVHEVQKIIEKFEEHTKNYVKSKDQEISFFKGEFQNKVPLIFYISIVMFTGVLGMRFLFLRK